MAPETSIGLTSTASKSSQNDQAIQNPSLNSFGMNKSSTIERAYPYSDLTSSSNLVTKNKNNTGSILLNNQHYNNLTLKDTSNITSKNSIIFDNKNNETSLTPSHNNSDTGKGRISLTTTTTATHYTMTGHLHNASISTESLVTKHSSNIIPSSVYNYPVNTTNADSINTIFNPFNTTTVEPSTQFIHEWMVPEQTTSGPFDNNYSTDYDYYHNNWSENGSVTINESVFYTNDSILLIPQYNYDGSNSFMNGITKIDSSPETIAKVFILALVSIFGSIGNFLVVGSVIKNRHFHRPPFYFLLSMGITDLARAGFCLPVVMATALQGSIWRHGDTACKLFAFAASFFVFSSTLSLLVISVERHLSIVHTKAYRRRCHGFINLFATMFIWVTAFIISFPPIFASLGAGEYVFISEEAQCTYDHKHFSENDGLNSVLTFIGITALTLFLYYRIFVFMRSHRRMRPLQHRPAFSSTWTFVGPGANGQAFINWLNGFGGNTSNAYQRPAAAAASTVTGTGSNSGPNSDRPSPPRYTQRLNFGRVVNMCTTKNEHLTRLFFIMTLVHGATWLPYVILSLWRVFVNSSTIPAGFITYAAWLSYSQVAICPLAYFVTRGRSRHTSRVIQMESTERNEFLLENKIFK